MNCKYCRANCTGAKHDRDVGLCLGYDPPKTNGDFIRAMSDEELATWLNCMQSNAYHCGEFGRTNAAYPYNNEAWLEWLKEEVSE